MDAKNPIKEIIILGMGPSKGECLFDAETWSCNTGYRQFFQQPLPETKFPPPGVTYYKSDVPFRLDKIFIAHAQCYDAEGDPIFNWQELNALVDRGVEIWNTHRVKKLKSRYLDWRQLTKKLGVNYFSNVLCFMIAKALDDYTVRDKKTGLLKLTQPLKLKLYGCDMQTFDEYGSEKGSMEAWLMFGKALGLEYYVAEGGLMFQTKTRKPYGEKHFRYQDIKYVGKDGKLRTLPRKRNKANWTINHENLAKIRCPNDDLR